MYAFAGRIVLHSMRHTDVLHIRLTVRGMFMGPNAGGLYNCSFESEASCPPFLYRVVLRDRGSTQQRDGGLLFGISSMAGQESFTPIGTDMPADKGTIVANWHS